MIFAFILLLGVTMPLTAAELVPGLNFDPSCGAAAKGNVGAQPIDTLAKLWKSFRAADRDSCYRLTTTGTPGTYTELLTRLEMRRDARALPNSKPAKK